MQQKQRFKIIAAMLSRATEFGGTRISTTLPAIVRQSRQPILHRVRAFSLPSLLLPFLLLALPLPAQSAAAGCPDLAPYYPGQSADWSTVQAELSALMPVCLQSSEFFALYGAAQLNNGAVADALESLERALLLDPDNGAAQIDFAQALFLEGQLFSALELNARLLQRDDLPANLLPALQERHTAWQAQTRQRSLQLDLLAGYDSNLNGAPDPSQITLTLSGESVILTLDPAFQPISGPYVNARLAARYRQLAPDHQHNVLLDVRGRVSEDPASDLLQADARYALIKPDRDHAWQLNTGLSHLLFGGKPLFSAAEVSARYQPRSGERCRSFAALAVQQQLYHDQAFLNALDGKASAGVNCPWEGIHGAHLLSLESGVLTSQALKDGRPGGNRKGWQVTLDWQYQMASGELRTLVTHTEMDDRDGYSPILNDGASRWLDRSYILLQYRRPLNPQMSLLFNFYHQDQRSNLELFQSVDSTVEIGLSLEF